MSETTESGDKKSVIRVAEDSSTHLEALFEVVYSGSQQAGPGAKKPGLPMSFTREPSKLEKRNNAHLRAASEPAYPFHQVPRFAAMDTPLPQGWEMAKTPDGLTYYIK